MQRCSSSHCNHPVGPCTCGGLYHSSSAGGNSNSFSMLFSSMTNPNHHQEPFNDDHHHNHFDAYPSSNFTTCSVDCTLSLGTPSTRHQTSKLVDNKSNIANHRKSTSCVSNICWDMFQTKQHHQNPNSSSGTYNKVNSRSSVGGSSSSFFSNFSSSTTTSTRSSSDAASITRRCANCDTTSTPLWRNGPRGPKSLCNACGIRYKKEERRSTTTNGSNTSTVNVAAASVAEPQQVMMSHHNSSWSGTHHHNSQRVTNSAYPPSTLLGSHEFRFIEDHHRDSTSTNSSSIPFLSWRLNVADRPSQLVHDYT